MHKLLTKQYILHDHEIIVLHMISNFWKINFSLNLLFAEFGDIASRALSWEWPSAEKSWFGGIGMGSEEACLTSNTRRDACILSSNIVVL